MQSLDIFNRFILRRVESSPIRRRKSVRLEALEDRTLMSADLRLAQPFELDLAESSQYSVPGDLRFAELDDRFLFVGDNGLTGSELWSSDGTEAGTSLVREIYPGSQGANPGMLKVLGDEVFFFANDPDHGIELWKSDGTEGGTQIVADKFSQPRLFESTVQGTSSNKTLVEANGRLFFPHLDPEFEQVLYVSDGTSDGTRIFMTFFDEDGFRIIDNDGVENLTEADDIFYFSARLRGDYHVYRSDGTVDGTFPIAAPFEFEPKDFKTKNNRVSFAVNGSVWASNGQLRDAYQVHAAERGGRVGFFTSRVLHHPFQDGVMVFEVLQTPSGRVGRIGIHGGLPSDLTEYFAGGDSATFNERLFVEIEQELFFYQEGPSEARGLWKTDGTSEGTVLMSTLVPELPTSVITTSYFAKSARLFFSTGRQWWSTDGTPSGTYIEEWLDFLNDVEVRKDGFRANGDVVFQSFPEDGPTTLQMLNFQQESPTLLQSDGERSVVSALASVEILDSLEYLSATAGDTWYFRDGQGLSAFSERLGLRPIEGVDGFRRLAVVGDDLYLSSLFRGVTTLQVVRQDSPNALRVTTNGFTGRFSFLGSLNGDVLFSANDEEGIERLWKSDGTADGTLALDIPVPIRHTIEFRGALYFAAPSSQASGWSLYRSDGTLDGTVELAEMGFSTPDVFVVKGGELYALSTFTAWKTDGTRSGTRYIADIVASEFASTGQALFAAASPITSLLLIDQSGVPEVVLKAYPGKEGIRQLTHFNDRVIFSADDGINGAELWVSDGTSEGTFMVKDIAPGASGSYPRDFTVHDGRVYFQADDREHGFELWSTDGTEVGTVLVRDFTNDSFSSHPRTFTLDGQLLSIASTFETGRRLYFTDSISTEPGIANVVVANGESGRSNVSSWAVAFDQPVDYHGQSISDAISVVLQPVRVPSGSTREVDFRDELFSLEVDTETGNSWLVFDSGSQKIPDGTFRVKISTTNLRNSASVAVDGDGDGLAGGDFEFEFHSLAGDVDGNGVVGPSDMLVVAQSLGTTPASAKWNANADVDLDGRISVRDRVYVARRLGEAVVPFDGDILTSDPLTRFDVTDDGDVSAQDALTVINYLARAVSEPMREVGDTSSFAQERLDVSKDGKVTALDALQVINQLNRLSAVTVPYEGEGIDPDEPSFDAASSLPGIATPTWIMDDEDEVLEETIDTLALDLVEHRNF